MRLTVGLLCVFAFVSAASAQTGVRFVPGCKVPLDSKRTAFDARCGIKGAGTQASKIAESKAKNNFCANTDSPVRMAPEDFDSLQSAADQLDADLSDRSVLHNLISVGNQKVGEGTVVEFIAFVLDAHYSNVSKGEAVNCKISGKPNNDIHIVLVQDPSDDPCTSITAEMSPHYRPSGWTDAAVNSAGKHPIRVRGQLFFDSSHHPCTEGKRQSPARRSVWEIHPAYGFDVCKKTTIEACKNAADSDWVPVEEWFGNEEDENASNVPQTGAAIHFSGHGR